MPQSLSAVYVHLIFSTKVRAPLLSSADLRSETHAYLGGVSKKLDCPPLHTGGTADHIHLLARLGRTVSQADWVKELKRVSSGWLKGRSETRGKFAWQAGYGAFSVSASNLDKVRAYIEGQDEHHRKRTFQDEYREFLRRYGIEWDERYVWD